MSAYAGTFNQHSFAGIDPVTGRVSPSEGAVKEWGLWGAEKAQGLFSYVKNWAEDNPDWAMPIAGVIGALALFKFGSANGGWLARNVLGLGDGMTSNLMGLAIGLAAAYYGGTSIADYVGNMGANKRADQYAYQRENGGLGSNFDARAQGVPLAPPVVSGPIERRNDGVPVIVPGVS